MYRGAKINVLGWSVVGKLKILTVSLVEDNRWFLN